VAVLALSAIGVAYGARTYLRNPDWQDNQTLYTKAEETDPESFKPHMILATTWLDLDPKLLNGNQAITEAEKAEAIISGLPDRWKPTPVPWILGTLYYTLGDSLSPKDAGGNPLPDAVGLGWYRKALDADLEAVRADRVHAEEYRRRELARGRTAEELAPVGTPDLYGGLGRIYLRLGDPQKALDAFPFERHIAPGKPEAYANLSLVDQTFHKFEDSAAVMLESYVLDGSQSTLHKLLDLYRQADPNTCATRREVEGATLNRDCPVVRRDFCRAYGDLEQGFRDAKQPDQAERFRDEAGRVPGCR
jgi:tetratricopeptide (TPR) repeat protein